jgi:hypothetical protein
MITLPPQMVQQAAQGSQGLAASAPAPQVDPSSVLMAAGEMKQNGTFDKYDNQTGSLGPPLNHRAHARFRRGR